MAIKTSLPDEWLGKIAKEQYEESGCFCETIENDNTFHIGKGYDNCPARALKCIFCGSTEFKVGTGSHFTAIKCKNCEWEECIHDG